MNDVTSRRQPVSALLAPDEPAPWWVHNPEGRAPVLVVCDHASAFVPRAFGQLGLEARHFDRHIAYDPGAAAVAQRLAGHLDAACVLSHFSRLVIDPNRQLDDPTLVPTVAENTVVPGNRGLAESAVQRRVATFFEPYHAEIERRLDALEARGPAPVLISVHSFTPVMHGRERPWDIGVLWDEDTRLAAPFMAAMAARGHVVGDNEPYSGRHGHGYTANVHGDGRGLANLLLELRQDLLRTTGQQQAWADTIAHELTGLLKDPALYRRRAE